MRLSLRENGRRFRFHDLCVVCVRVPLAGYAVKELKEGEKAPVGGASKGYDPALAMGSGDSTLVFAPTARLPGEGEGKGGDYTVDVPASSYDWADGAPTAWGDRAAGAPEVKGHDWAAAPKVEAPILPGAVEHKEMRAPMLRSNASVRQLAVVARKAKPPPPSSAEGATSSPIVSVMNPMSQWQQHSSPQTSPLRVPQQGASVTPPHAPSPSVVSVTNPLRMPALTLPQATHTLTPPATASPKGTPGQGVADMLRRLASQRIVTDSPLASPSLTPLQPPSPASAREWAASPRIGPDSPGLRAKSARDVTFMNPVNVARRKPPPPS